MTDMVGNVEKSVRSHTGILQLAQAILSGLVLMLVTSFYNSAHEASERAVERAAKQSESILLMQAQLDRVHDELSVLHSQLSDVPSLVREVAKMSVTVENNARRIQELEQARKLR